jgi:coenzyme F420 biosynthesis associated uncharacterized protein
LRLPLTRSLTDGALRAYGGLVSPTASAPTAPVDLLVDWDLAARTAAVVGRPGPQLSAAQAADVVNELRGAARLATRHVTETARLVTEDGPAVLVVDRAGWARVNATAFRSLLEPVVEEAFERRGRTPGSALAAVGSRITAAEVGSLLGMLSSRVLGQYDPFSTSPGRLLLVAPNVVQIETDLGADPADFRLWVCLHEETHRVQFAATPWLAEHLQAQIRLLVADLMLEPGQVAERLVEAVRSIPELIRGGSSTPLLDAVQTPEQRARLARLTAVMSLLEGHADVIMDEVGPQVVPTVAVIRERFDRRRAGRGILDQVLRRLLGLEAKMRQYADGARFVRGVMQQVGTEGFNAVWTSADTLPEPTEIADPIAWVRRVHG